MEKVAFLNLTYDSFNHDHIWKQFFDEGDPNAWNLYIHSKTKEPSVFSKYYLNKPVPTAWGHFSLVRATIAMMREALRDKKNEYFTLISGSHIPLYGLDEMVEIIKNKYKKTTFAKHFSYHTKVKSQKVLRVGAIAPHPFDLYNAVCQFCVWRRKDVISFVTSFEEYSRFFKEDQVIFADEFYFWAVARDLKMDFEMGQATTYSDWSIRPHPQKQGEIDRNPRAFTQISQPMIDVYRENGYIFARKVMVHTLVMADPLKPKKQLEIK